MRTHVHETTREKQFAGASSEAWKAAAVAAASSPAQAAEPEQSLGHLARAGRGGARRQTPSALGDLGGRVAHARAGGDGGSCRGTRAHGHGRASGGGGRQPGARGEGAARGASGHRKADEGGEGGGGDLAADAGGGKGGSTAVKEHG